MRRTREPISAACKAAPIPPVPAPAITISVWLGMDELVVNMLMLALCVASLNPMKLRIISPMTPRMRVDALVLSVFTRSFFSFASYLYLLCIFYDCVAMFDSLFRYNTRYGYTTVEKCFGVLWDARGATHLSLRTDTDCAGGASGNRLRAPGHRAHPAVS